MLILNEPVIETLSKKFSIHHGPFTELIKDQDFVDIIDSFHISGSFLVIRADDYFCGIRANHFCVKTGFLDCEPDDLIIVVEGNHKGNLAVNVIRIPNANIYIYLEESDAK